MSILLLFFFFLHIFTWKRTRDLQCPRQCCARVLKRHKTDRTQCGRDLEAKWQAASTKNRLYVCEMVFGTILTLRRDAFLSPALRVYLTHMYLAYKIAHNTRHYGCPESAQVHGLLSLYLEDLVSVSLCARPRGLKWLVNGERDRTIRQARYFHMFAARCKRASHVSRDAKRRSWNREEAGDASRGNKLEGSAECVWRRKKFPPSLCRAREGERERERERENLLRSRIFWLPSRSRESCFDVVICPKSILRRIISASSSAVNQHACARSSNFRARLDERAYGNHGLVIFFTERETFLMEKHDPLLRYYKSILRRLEGARLYVKARSNFFNLD